MKKKLSIKTIELIIEIVLSAFVIIVVVNAIKSDSPHYPECYAFSQELVKEKLKSPMSADFPAYDPDFFSEKDGKVYVTSYVDAQNSLGATVRTKFIATIEVNSKGKPTKGSVVLL